MRMTKSLQAIVILTAVLFTSLASADDRWVVYEGKEGPGKGKHIVLIAGDEEYRSEEAMPQLGKILAVHHGFKCTVLFSQNPKTGEIDPNNQRNIPGLEALKTADLMMVNLRFRNLPDEQMKHIVDYVEGGGPVIGMRTATHAFSIRGESKYKKYSNGYGGADYRGGFGRQVLGEKWISHHGGHGRQSTRGIVADGAEKHPIMRGIKSGDIWGTTDVYGVRLPLPKGCQTLVLGQVLVGMKFDDKPLEGKKNDPMMPVGWVKSYTGASAKSARIFTTTMGASQDLVAEGSRRMLVNAAYWCLSMEAKIAAKSKVDIVGEYKPTPFGGGRFKKGVKPADHKL
ncbi:MAG: ThuA domain-containing protein [Planctomycetes bacterium]|nr:ThuA domain-containing protein [Planctomycetota bacterium]